MAVVTIHTTQNVRIDYDTAGVGARIGAFCLDLLVIALTYFLALFLLESIDVRQNVSVAYKFAPIFYFLLYFFCWETLSRGQTAGKRVLRLRVIRLDGHDPTPADFLGRAVFLLADVVFTAGTLAVLLVATGPQRQRLGDLVARTVVINTGLSSSVRLDDILTIRRREGYTATYPSVQRLADDDLLIVKQCLVRYRRYHNRAHREALATLAVRVAALLEISADAVPTPHETFLETVLLDYIVLTR